jgi:uncharacterized membrane protein (DUF485 family)
MLHEPAAPVGKDPAFGHKRRLGVILFAVYGTIYAGFVAISVLVPGLMGRIVLAGLNLAVVYGFGLIVFALLLALVYNAACSRKEAMLADKEDGK